MKIVDLLRNHSWNMQALVTDHEDSKVDNFEVRIEPIEGRTRGLEKNTFHTTKETALAHARTVLGLD